MTDMNHEPAVFATSDSDPAIAFISADEATDTLEEWADQRARLDGIRDQLIAGALAAGVEPSRIHRITGLSRSTINRIPRTEAAVTATPHLELSDLLRARAARYRAHADATGGRDPHTLHPDHIRAIIATSVARMLSEAPIEPIAIRGGDDVAVALTVSDLRVQVGRAGDDASVDPAAVDEYRRIIAEIDAIRRHGSAAFDADPFAAADVAAGRTLSKRESDEQWAALAGVPVEKWADMSHAQKAAAMDAALGDEDTE